MSTNTPADNTPADDDKKFIDMADSFIDLANQHCDKAQNPLVNASMLYGTARFCAFITASMAQSKQSYEDNIDNAINYYTEEFAKMLKEHMEQYKSAFEAAPRYEHLMKKNKEE